jgi:hypothetical protein
LGTGRVNASPREFLVVPLVVLGILYFTFVQYSTVIIWSKKVCGANRHTALLVRFQEI